MPTFESLARFDREFRRLPTELQAAFPRVLPTFITALRGEPALVPPDTTGQTRAGPPRRLGDHLSRRDGRATFAYGDEVIAGTPHVIWRRVGTHEVLRDA